MLSINKHSGNGDIPTSYQHLFKFDQENFLPEFSDISWHKTLKDDGNVDASFDSFSSIMSGLIDPHLPTVKLT